MSIATWSTRPRFLTCCPDVRGLRGLDIGCDAVGIDINFTFIRHARTAEQDQPAGIRYGIASGQRLPFADVAFDFVTAFMSLMDMPEPERALREAVRIMKTGG